MAIDQTNGNPEFPKTTLADSHHYLVLGIIEDVEMLSAVRIFI